MTKKEERFFDIVQEEAAAQGMKFFLECGEGREIETEDLLGEDMSGWLVPSFIADEVQQALDDDPDSAEEKFPIRFVFAVWSQNQSGKITIQFMDQT